MSETVDLTARLTSIEAQLRLLEMALSGLTSEVSRGFGQMQQQLARAEQRFDVIDAALTLLRTEIATGNATLLRAIKGDA